MHLILNIRNDFANLVKALLKGLQNISNKRLPHGKYQIVSVTFMRVKTETFPFERL